MWKTVGSEGPRSARASLIQAVSAPQVSWVVRWCLVRESLHRLATGGYGLATGGYLHRLATGGYGLATGGYGLATGGYLHRLATGG